MIKMDNLTTDKTSHSDSDAKLDQTRYAGKKLSLAFVIYRFGKHIGGAERVAYEISKRLISQGHELHVFSYSYHNVSDISAIFHSVPISKFPYFYKRYSFAKNVGTMLKDYTFDAVQSFSRIFWCDIYRFGCGVHNRYLDTTKTNFLSRFLARINPKHILENAIERRSFRNDSFKYVVAVSNLEKSIILKTYDISEDKIMVIHNGVDTSSFNPAYVAANREKNLQKLNIKTRFNILFSGNGFKRKGLDHVLRVMAQLKKRKLNVTLLVVGKGDFNTYRALAKKLGVADVTLFLGHRVHMEKYYACGNVLCLPTLFDPFPNTCLEAMSCSVPVITTANTGIAEIIEDKKDSFILSYPDKTDEAADIITKLYNNKDEYERISRNARSKALDFDWDKVVTRYLQLYYSVANGR